MLEVHPPHEAAHSWRDFFIHIATICVGLLIAIGLEQTVEALHHRHQREYLEEQMHAESARNLELVKSQLAFVTSMLRYVDAYQQALETAPTSGGLVTVSLPANDGGDPSGSESVLISPSQGTWAVAKAAGTVALLAPESAKIYARLDLVADFEQTSESTIGRKASVLKSAQMRAHIPLDTTAPTRITAAARDDLIFANSQYRDAMRQFQFRLAIEAGALEAVLDHIHSLEEMYPYQERALKRFGARNLLDRRAPPS